MDEFCSEILSVHAENEKVETINVHCLRHLTEQVKRFGPLYSYSAMSFESANRTLGEVCSGSSSECEIICRRILQRHKLSGIDICNEHLQPLFSKLSGQRNCNPTNFTNELVETEAVIECRSQYPTSKIINRFLFDGVYLDSPAYTRSKLGNCFVYFKTQSDQEIFGQIQCFLQIPESPYNNSIYAFILVFSVLQELGPVKKMFYRLQKTPLKNLQPVKNYKNSLFL